MLERLRTAIEEQRLLRSVPGVAVGVRTPDGTRIECFGVTSVEHPLAVTPSTVFPVASASKTLTATLIMQLITEGRLSLSDELRTVWPEYPRDDGVTIEQLLTHRAGWNGDAVLMMATDMIDTDRMSLAHLPHYLADIEVLAPPGVVTTYNNMASSALGRVAEVLTGQTFEQLIRSRLAGPAGLDPIGLCADDVITERVAMPHTVDASGETVVIRRAGPRGRWSYPASSAPAGGVVMSMAGLMNWAEVQLGQRPDVLHPDAASDMRRQRVPFHNMADGVGLCLMLRNAGGTTLVEHGGNLPGYQTSFTLLPGHDAAVAICTNSQSGATLIRDVRRLLLDELFGVIDAPVAVDDTIVADLEEIAGTYQLPASIATLVPSGERRVELSFESRELPGGRRWPTPPTMLAGFSAPDEMVALSPEPIAGQRFDIVRVNGEVRWLRFGGRIGARIDAG